MRTMNRSVGFSLFLAAGLQAGCGCGTSIDNEDDVRIWANTASAVAVYSGAYDEIAFADGQESYDDPDCPATTDDGTTVTIEGGCVGSGGTEWVGSVTIARSGGDRSVTFDGWGWGDPETDRSLKTGTFDLVETGADLHEFHADVVDEGGMTVTVEYDGTVEGGYAGPTTWNGTGTIERDGMVSPTGTIQAETHDEVLDGEVCGGQAISGTTTIREDDRVVVITYDGATDCDSAQSAQWSLDGEDKGLITGITCSAAPGARPSGSHSASTMIFFASALVLASLRHRRTGGRLRTG